MNHGFIKVAAAIPDVKVADCTHNSDRIVKLIEHADSKGVELVCFPELSITSYTCGDLFFQELLLESAKQSLLEIVEKTARLNIISIVGLPLRHGDKLFNVAAIFGRGNILGFVPKTYLPNYNEFYEKRWFVSANDSPVSEIMFDKIYPFTSKLIIGCNKAKFAVEICEDLWTPNPPSSFHSIAGANLIFNLSASNEITGKYTYRKALVEQQSARCIAGYVYAGAGWGESTTDLVFSGNAMIYENGALLSEAERFLFEEQLIIADIDTDRLKSQRAKNTSFEAGNEDYMFINLDFPEKETQIDRYINHKPFVPAAGNVEVLNEIFSIQTGGLAKRLSHTNIQKTVLGISGGLDSTLALLVCVKTCDKLKIPRENIIGITMPGFGTSRRTLKNALMLMKKLGVTGKTIDIKPACKRHFKDIEHNPEVFDITFENTQARERTQILMDFANQCNGLVIGTGDMSELALGWATYNGDHISMYGVNAGVPKTLVKSLVRYVSETQLEYDVRHILEDILDTPISPELLPMNAKQEVVQPTESIVGPYELHDFFLYYLLRHGYSPAKIYFMAKTAFKNIYGEELILKWLKVFYKRFFTQQFKRSCLPDGPKVGSVNLSPRGDWRMPSDASYSLWLNELDSLG